jgi:hypothetical protein
MSGDQDLSVLHRWELLHMIWEPFALGASGRVLSVLFRVLPPGRSLWMSESAVAREAAVTKRTVSRAYAEFRAERVLITAPDGKPTIDYMKALDAAIRSVVSRPLGERERRLERLQEIAHALGTSINEKYVKARLAEFEVKPWKRLPGRQIRDYDTPRMERWLAERDQREKEEIAARGHVVPDRGQADTSRGHVVPASGSRCPPELNTNSNSEQKFESAAKAKRLVRLYGVPDVHHFVGKAEYAGKPTLPVQVLGHVRGYHPNRTWRRSELSEHLDVAPVRIGQALKILCERGHAERVGHGIYLFNGRAEG